ncbi:hypothetical protein [Planococcus versutus]|uniref:Uncharacterized protein n=1 Tax=Planococcus versutus TaxID=1302659 RepID=A0A1B1RZG9_9BACL|nr:hypothetical protein [Planococcus versutus]ANU26317.1 hypothetical protein I858_004625 [Planococcus versutus]
MENISVNFNYQLNETESAIINASLGEGERENTHEKLNGIAKASFEEYLKLIVGGTSTLNQTTFLRAAFR